MANPTRFPSGVSTFPVQHIMNTFPMVPNNYQIVKSDDFLPYRTADYTATVSGTGAITPFAWNGGAVQITNGATAASNAILSLGASGNQADTYQFVPGNQLWFDTKVATGGAASTGVVTSANSTLYVGLFDAPTTPNSGVKYAAYFTKPVGGSTWNFVLVNTVGATTYTTTFTNVADTNNPSGIFGDPYASNAALVLNGAAGYYTTVTSTTGGAGYKYAPLIVATGSTGAGAQLYSQHGAAGSPISTGGSGLNNVWITNQGNGAYTTYTAATLPWINLQFYYDGKGTIRIGVNGQQVMSVGNLGVTNPVFNGSNTNATGQSYTTSTVSAAAFPTTGYLTAPYTNDAYTMLPKSQMQFSVGMIGATTASQLFWVDEFNIGTEFN